jgi:hypothetical protein
MPWARRACAYASMAVGSIRCSADRDVPQATSACHPVALFHVEHRRLAQGRFAASRGSG